MTNVQIQYMVNRFLGWRLPEDFRPDGGIRFKPTYNEGTPFEAKHQPSGTNLLNASQAEAMIRYLVEGIESLTTPESTYTLGVNDSVIDNDCSDDFK